MTNDGLPRGAGHQRKVERTRGRGQSGHTSPPRTQAEVPAYAIECGGVLQLRENFADEREDHAVSSLTVRLRAEYTAKGGVQQRFHLIRGV